MEGVHRVDEQLIGLLLEGVDADDVVVEGLGALEVGEVVHQRPHLFAAADQHIDKPGDIRPDGGDAVVVELDDNVFDLVDHIVEVVADLEDIFPLDGGDEGFDEDV